MNTAHEPKTFYGVILATNMYAGNFERELTAYCTGRIGECEVGASLVALFYQDLGMTEADGDSEKDPFWDCIAPVPDDHGCLRPCSIFEHNGHYNAVIIYFADAPTKEQVELITQRAKAYAGDERIKAIDTFYAKPDLEVLDVYLVKVQTTVEQYRL